MSNYDLILLQNQIDAINPAQQNLHQVSYMSSDDEMDMDDASTTLTRPNHSATTLNVENYSAASSLLAAPANVFHCICIRFALAC